MTRLLLMMLLALPAIAQQPVTVTYIEQTSTDPEGSALSYLWTINGPAGGATLQPSGNTVDVTYSMEGTYELTVAVSDEISTVLDTFTTVVTVNLPPTPPAIEGPDTVVLPPLAAVISGPDVQVAAEVTDPEPSSGIAGVQFMVGDQPLGQEDTITPYEVTWDTTAVPDDQYCLWATARDMAGNVGMSDPCTLVRVANSQ